MSTSGKVDLKGMAGRVRGSHDRGRSQSEALALVGGSSDVRYAKGREALQRESGQRMEKSKYEAAKNVGSIYKSSAI
jgi:hypothetical protein